MPAEAGAEKTTGKSLDILTDGTTYARVKATGLTSGGINYASGTHTGILPRGNHCADVTSTINTGGGIDFSSALHTNKTLQYLTDGGGRYAAAESNANVTNAHVLTATANPSSNFSTNSTSYVAVTGFGFSLTASGASDVYNLTTVFALAPYSDGTLALCIDGNTTSPKQTITLVGVNSLTTVTYPTSFTGLASGSHTVQWYAKATTSNSVGVNATSSSLCQRIF
jgi:hypothetical protein